MNEVVHCNDDLESFYEPLGLYIKPCARLNISLSLPPLKQPGQSISNWDLMEKIKRAVLPVQLSSIRVALSTMEIVRFEAELPTRKMLNKVIKALEGYSLKVAGFYDPVKVRVSEAKSNFPCRHDWDEFFRTARDMDELKPGERPDTIYMAKLPSNWFKEDGGELPSERLLRRVFEQFGTVRCVDIPSCDTHRRQMPQDINGIKVTGFSFGQEVLFEAYVQFTEYISFMRAMNALRNMKLVKRMADGRLFEAAVKVDFDRSKHLSERSIGRRDAERERIIREERDRMSEEQRRKEEEEDRRKMEELAKETRRREKEEKRRLKREEEKRIKEERKLEDRIRREEKKLCIAKRKLESRRLLSELSRRSEAPENEKKESKEEEKEPEGQEGERERTVQVVSDPVDSEAARCAQLDLEAKLRQTLLREQELRLRKRIEAKMLLRMGASEQRDEAQTAHKHRKRKLDQH